MDDPKTPIEGWARFRMPYLKIAAVVALGTGILAVGVLGPHPAPRPTPSADASLIARIPSPTAPTVAPFPAPSTSPTVPIANRSDSLVGLTRVVPLADQIKVSWLPGQITSGSMAVVGMRIFYVVDANRIQSTEVGSDQAGQSLVSVPSCEGINQLAAAGHELAYVVTSPGGPTATVHDCGGAGRVSWSVWLLDLNGGSPRRVAQGVRAASSIEIDEFPIHLALTDSAYAFNRPPISAAAGLGETVEVHAIDGQLLWTSRTKRPVASVMLGGGTLAILTDVLSQADGVVNLYTSSAARPDPAPMDQPAASASLSPDGLHLAWDVAYQGPFPGPNPGVDVAIGTVASGVEKPLVTLTDHVAPAPLRPAISSTSRGLLVTWFATAPNGAVYPAVRYATGGNGAFVPTLQEPIWMNVQGGTLFWVAESAGGWSNVAFAVDLATLGLN